MNDLARTKLDSAIRECDAHIGKLERGQGLLAEFFPLTARAFRSLDESRLEHIDQFIYRFSKLQDAMGKRLFPTLYGLLEEDESPRPFIDILTRLEKLGVITDAEDWQVLRNIRNTIAHEYPGASTNSHRVESVVRKASGYAANVRACSGERHGKDVRSRFQLS